MAASSLRSSSGSSLVMARRYHIGIFGPEGCGRNSIARRYAKNIFQQQPSSGSVEERYVAKKLIKDQVYKLEILVTSGQDVYLEMMPAWIRKCDAFMLVYTITSRHTFHRDTLSPNSMYERVVQLKGTTNVPFVLVGNKLDLDLDEGRREVPTEEAKSFAAQKGIPFFETSALMNTNIDESFAVLMSEIIRIKDEQALRTMLNIETPKLGPTMATVELESPRTVKRKSRLSSLFSRREKSNSEISAALTNSEPLPSRNSHSTANTSKSKKLHDKQRWLEERMALMDMNAILQDQNDTLNREKRALTEAVEREKREVKAVKELLEQMRMSIEQMQATVSALRMKKSMLKEELAHTKARLQEHVALIETNQLMKAELERERERLLADKQTMERQIESQTRRIMQLQDGIFTLERINTELKQQLEDAKTSATLLRAEFEAAKLQFASERIWEIGFSELTFDESPALGEGNFGRVVKAYWRRCPVAVKILKSAATSESLAQFRNEASLLRTLRPHGNVVQLFGVCSHPSQPPCIVTEFIAGGNLKRWLLTQTRQGLPLPSPMATVRLLMEIAAGMAHLHAEGILHRDLAARNVLLKRDGDVIDDFPYRAVISDFGLSRQTELYITSVAGGAYKWMPPEYLRLEHSVFSRKSDVWSYGVLIWEVLTGGGDPFVGNDDIMEVARAIHTPGEMARRHPPPRWHAQPITALMTRCWEADPETRPSFEEAFDQLDAMRRESTSTRPNSSENVLRGMMRSASGM